MQNLRFNLSLIILLIAGFFSTTYAQVKITDGTNVAMDINSILELESSNKGFLPPRVSLTSLTSVTPLTSPIPSGMLIYNISGGAITEGFYTWDGTKWKPFSTGVGSVNLVAKTATSTLTKTETMVLASNSITLTLPAVTAEDNGLNISIKNVGSYTDLVTVVGNGGATIDNKSHWLQTRYEGVSYIAYNGNWIIRNAISHPDNEYDVSSSGSWTTLPEIIAYLQLHMNAPSVIRIGSGTLNITTTQSINLPYSLTIEGLSFGSTTLTSSGLNPMFSCASETYFKMLVFQGASGTAIQLTGSGEYYEIKDCTFDGFGKGILISSNCDVWVFENDFSNIAAAAVELAAGGLSGLIYRMAETDFTNCAIGVNLLSGTNASIAMSSGTYTLSAGQIGVNYVPTSFTSVKQLIFTGNSWNGLGTFGSGFDYTRTDGRDANFFVENNAGVSSRAPKCKINVVNNTLTTSLSTANTWYKVNWTNTSTFTVNWLITNNRFQFLPSNTRDILIIVTGNIIVNTSNNTINIGIVKNGVSSTRYGETTLRVPTASQAYQFATTIYIQNVLQSDYFELFASSTSGGDVATFQDVNIFVGVQ